MFDPKGPRAYGLRTLIQFLRQTCHFSEVPFLIRIRLCKFERLRDESMTSCGSDGVDVIARGLGRCCVDVQFMLLDDLDRDSVQGYVLFRSPEGDVYREDAAEGDVGAWD